MSLVDSIIKDPIATLKTLSNKEIVNVLQQADERFFNTGQPLFTDDIYDVIKQYLRKQDPKNAYLKTVGAEIELNKEKLPFYMGSLDKIKDNESELIKWKNKYEGNYVISEKLDGISCLLYHDKGNTKLYTRGDGYNGQNITHILPYLDIDLSKISSKIAIRGELIISRNNWKKISDSGANARNVVAGAIHSKTINSNIVSKIDFVAYDILYPRQTISQSLQLLEQLGIPFVKHILTDKLSLEVLSETLQTWRKESKYEIDGIVVYHDEVHKLMSGKNPKFAFAFKTILTHEQAEVIVNDVEWNVSKHRYLKPLVKFNEVVLAGVKIKQATGFNASYIVKNKIGPGARVVIVRSGDVIPHIISVLSPAASGSAKMPDIPYVWTDTNIDIILSGSEKNKEQDIQAFTHFMKTLAIEGVKEGTISKLYDAGYDSLSKIIHISINDLKTIDGIQEKSANKIHASLQEILHADCNKLMVASNVFGRGLGEKKLKLVTDVYPYVASDKKKALKLTIDELLHIQGFAHTSASQFIEGLPKYFDFYEALNIKCKTISPHSSPHSASPVAKTHKKLEKFQDKKIVFSGFRNKDFEEILTKHGAKIMSSVSKATDYLIVKSASESSTKIEKAVENDVKIITKEELEKMLEVA